MRKKVLLLFLIISFSLKAQHWQDLGNYHQFPVISLCSDSSYLFAGEQYSVTNATLVSQWNGLLWDSVGSHCTLQPRKLIIFRGDLICSACITGAISFWNGNSWNILGQITGSASGLDVSNNELYLTGDFDSIGGTPCSSIAKWDGNSWSRIDTTKWDGLGAANCAVSYNGELFMGGNFANYNNSLNRLVKWNGFQWQSVGNISFGAIAGVNCMIVYKGELYIGGLFNGVFPGAAGNGIARWNGSRWDDMQGGIGDPPSQVFALQVYNDELYVAGNFSTAGGVPSSCIAKWDGSRWCSLGGYCDNGIACIAVYDSSIIVGGSFDIIGGDSISKVAKWVGGNYVDSCTTPIGINEQVQVSELYFYPNPITGILNLVFDAIEGSIKNILIYNNKGQIVYSEKVTVRSQFYNKEINLNYLNDGIYLLQLSGEKIMESRKFILDKQ
ncbi:MAG: T9SS type A sorting domain-containing protein [Bacteroidota bacterium]